MHSMGIFFLKNKEGHLGIDVGASGVKLVELESSGGRARLRTYAYADRPLAAVEKNPFEDPAALGALIKTMVGRAKVRSREATAAVATAHVFSSVMTVPATGDKEIAAAVELQARKLMPLPLEQMHWDSKVLEKKEKFTRVLVTGASNSLVQQIMSAFKVAGIKLATLEPESFALVRALIGRDAAPTVVVDLGGLRTNILIVERGVPELTRSIIVGGYAATKAIAQSSMVGIEDAERLKLDAPNDASFASILPTIINEIKYLVQNFISASSEPKNVEKIILTGGASRSPGIVDAVRSATGIKTYLGDPWARILCPDELRPELELLGTRFAVAIGLAMRDLQPKNPK